MVNTDGQMVGQFTIQTGRLVSRAVLVSVWVWTELENGMTTLVLIRGGVSARQQMVFAFSYPNEDNLTTFHAERALN